MLIEVTREDIDHGLAGSCGSCPVALAIRRRFPDGWVRVGIRCVYAGGRAYHLPSGAIEFIERFDGGMPVEPFSFELDIRV